MARLLYLDCSSGIAGDMFLGACLDAGLPIEALRAALGSLGAGTITIAAERVTRAGVAATRFDIVDEAHRQAPAADAAAVGRSTAERAHGGGAHGHRTLAEILTLIERSSLSAAARGRACGMFQRLASVEAAIHGVSVAQVHLHEVGALDSIVDIVGAAFAMEWVGAERVVCSPLTVGSGTVATEHGLLPVPAPATLRLLTGVPIQAGRVAREMVTPTGALIATGYAGDYGGVPPMVVRAVGYGAGSRDNPGQPNVLRLLIGDDGADGGTDRVVVLECEIDDMNPQLFGVVMERLYEAGALEVCYVPVQMKKNRPGTRLTVLGRPADREALAAIVFRETTTLGVRHSEVGRETLTRSWVTVTTAYGPVRVKQARHHGRLVNAVPEFEDCAALARQHGVAVKAVQARALQAYGEQEGTQAS